MSEHQHYEFLAIDRPLDADAQSELRATSSRARISATHFVNTYQWGDFRGDPVSLMQRYFDFHLYWANWGSRRLMVRVPNCLVDAADVARFVDHVEEVTLIKAGDDLIIDIICEEEDPDDEDFDEDGSRLGGIVPVRADILNGDMRFFYVLWLLSVQSEMIDEGALEPLPGIGPLTASLSALGNFLRIDPDVLAAAAERTPHDAVGIEANAVAPALSAVPIATKDAWLMRLHDGDMHVGADVRRAMRGALQGTRPQLVMPARSVRDLFARASEIAKERIHARHVAAEARRKEEAEAAERAMQARMNALVRKGDAVWPALEAEIARCNATGYSNALRTLLDLRALAVRDQTEAAFAARLANIHQRHHSKRTFIQRLNDNGL
jgi:hypothetical protein